MPGTAVLFLIGAAAISALPPLNGFASEWLTFQGLLLLGQRGADGGQGVAAAIAAGLLALTGALAAACFVKAFGIAFLGLPRSESAVHATESPVMLRAGMGLLAAGCIAAGLFPGIAIRLLAGVVGGELPSRDPALIVAPGSMIFPLALLVTLAGCALAVGLAVHLLQGPAASRRVPTWVCGFALQPDMTYGAMAFAKPIRLFFRAIVRPERLTVPEHTVSAVFPSRITTHASVAPVFERHLYGPVSRGFVQGAMIARVVQGGNLRLYLSYVLGTLVVLLAVAR
jgi:hydrogenase-4 component B